MNCYRTSDNKFFSAPPKMSDGRHFTDYRPSCDVNNMIRNDNKITNSFDYKLFLTNNADKIMEINQKHNYAKNGVFKCKNPYEVGTMLPEMERIVCDEHSCNIVHKNDNGIGRGREYSVNPNELLDAFKAPNTLLEDNKCAKVEDSFNYYPLDSKRANDIQRESVRGGDILSGGDPNVYH